MSWLNGAPGKNFVGCAQTFVSWMCRNTPVPTQQLEYEKQLDSWNMQPFYIGTQFAEDAETMAWGRPMNTGVIPYPTTVPNNVLHLYDGVYGSAPMDVGGVVRRMAAEALNPSNSGVV